MTNQDEAYELACLKRDESNLARCYLELRERLACQSAAAPPMVSVEAFSELLRGLEMPPTSAALPPSTLYAIGTAIARQAKGAVPPSPVLLEVLEALKVGWVYAQNAAGGDKDADTIHAAIAKLREWMGEKG